MAPATTHRVARASMLPSYDWPATHAFSMPTDQHGWIRINLRGREAAGLVPPREYDALVSGLADRVRGLRTAAGAPLVRDVFRTAASADEAQGLRLPDLVVHWEDAVFAAPQAIAGSAVKTAAIGTKFSGQHSLEGFCIVRGPGGPASGAVRAEDLGPLMASRLAGPG
jgi:predicted AlkP superfamily phosphohydrolase/phosphomutase